MLDMPDRAPQLISVFSDGPVVVLAPHMDDEIIGPGGAVIRHVQDGARVAFIFMTDGLAGDPELMASNPSAEELTRKKREMSEVRKDESRAAAQMVGVNDLLFLDGPDGNLSDSPEMINALATALSQRKAALIYAPALTDNHKDHWATNRVLRRAIEKLPPTQVSHLTIRGYEVWSALPANRMADITAVARQKQQAINAFTSQLKYVDYNWTAMGLNQYRSMVHLHGHGHAEAFLELTAAQFCEFFDAILVRSGKK